MADRLLATVWKLGWALCLAAVAARGEGPQPEAKSGGPAAVDYNRTVRPILSNNCYACHGPDEKARRAGLRLDVREDALEPTELGHTAIVPGKPAESELVRRVFSTEANVMMPPPTSNKKLTEAEKEALKAWIEQGAAYQQHWSFVAPKRPELPKVSNPAWPRNGIDPFILARLDAEGLRPSPEADKVTLIRRVALDLTGLPPTPEEVDAFLADTSPEAYEKVVDRLLASPRYGERMALEWLDAARYADTHGYHIDSGRDMWAWREWVIDAFNRNLPFDRFTIEQMAGDLLPAPTPPSEAAAQGGTGTDWDSEVAAIRRQRLIASGFQRNHMINYEGGAIPEEYHTAYIVDRVNTMGTVWLGLTIGCAQCHEHKYDPITQKEYYQLYAFFHNVPEKGLDGQKGNAAPVLKLPTREQEETLKHLASAIQGLEQWMNGPMARLDSAQAAWERTALAEQTIEWTVLDPSEFQSKGGAALAKLEDKSILASGENPATETYTVVAQTDLNEITALRLEALPDDSLPAKGPGRSSNGNIVLTEVRLAVGPAVAEAGQDAAGTKAVKLKAASADFSQQDYAVAGAIDDKAESGWALLPEVGKPHAAVFELEEPVRLEGGAVLAVTLDFQSRFAQHQLGRFRLAVTRSKDPHGANKLPANVREALELAAEQRSDRQRAELRDYYRSTFSEEYRVLKDQLAKLRQTQAELDAKVPTTMVMREMEKPRETFLLIRGQYDKKGEPVTAGLPASLPPLPPGVPASRLGLARWLVDSANPLTARVIVNRYWQLYFGTGIVKTAEDFGSQGEQPSHPALLDWLACEFMSPSQPPLGRGGSQAWNIKGMQKLIVTSATYRQSSAVTPALFARDQENRLLARGPRLRLPAEFIRDQALAASGLLNGEIGGPSVFPYQPAGLWEELAFRQDNKNFSAQVYEQSHGKDLYRRTMYTFWKRTSPPPTLVTLDAPDRETCTVRRPRTNTPLQALVLMNDPTYVEASRKLAERMLTEAGPSASAEERIRFAFRLVLARRPSADEAALLTRVFEEQLEVYRADAEAARKLLTVGESPRNEKLDAAELAAWAVVANVIFNLDETLTKG